MNTIGITMGCPAGIGPEIILRYFHQYHNDSSYNAIVLGDIGVLKQCKTELNLDVPLFPWQPGQPIPQKGIPVFELSSLAAGAVTWGHPDTITAEAMVTYIRKGVELIDEGIINAITTCPISKASLNSAGYSFPGHTEMLADLTGSDSYAMMMSGEKLKITLVTIHCPLKAVPETLSIENISQLIETTHLALSADFGIQSPKIGVAGLNPHSGEDGLFGNEEIVTIAPAVSACRDKGIKVSGPFPPDTIFFSAVKGNYDAVVCMYHDQGLIPFKLLHFNDGVNVTLGLSIVRTSVDHGTAYDIAGKGTASCDSLMEAIKLANIISVNRARYLSKSTKGQC